MVKVKVQYYQYSASDHDVERTLQTKTMQLHEVHELENVQLIDIEEV